MREFVLTHSLPGTEGEDGAVLTLLIPEASFGAGLQVRRP